jgi:hypothetical protein
MEYTANSGSEILPVVIEASTMMTSDTSTRGNDAAVLQIDESVASDVDSHLQQPSIGAMCLEAVKGAILPRLVQVVAELRRLTEEDNKINEDRLRLQELKRVAHSELDTVVTNKRSEVCYHQLLMSSIIYNAFLACQVEDQVKI